MTGRSNKHTRGREAKRGHLTLVKNMVEEVFDDGVMPWDEAAGSRVKGEDGLTPRQRRFVNAMLAGAPSASAAYREAYTTSNMADKTIWDEASRLMAHPVVSQRLRQGFAEQEERAVLNGASRSRFVIERLQHEALHATADASRVAPDLGTSRRGRRSRASTPSSQVIGFTEARARRIKDRGKI